MLEKVRALAVDVFGTVVDWHGSIVREGEEWSAETGIRLDWGAFAQAWRAEYVPSMQRVRSGEIPWTGLDKLHRISLDQILRRFSVEGLSQETLDHWNRVWHRLSPWPDSAEALERMRELYVVTCLSNGNVSLLIELSKRGGLQWDAVLSAELFRHYKPDREVYLGAAALLDCAPNEVMMVAAHVSDLRAARDCGFRTAFVARPLEHGPNGVAEKPEPGEFDLTATDLLDLALQLD